MRGARARCFASVRVRTKVRTVRGSHLVRTPTIDSTPPATAFVGGFFIFRTRIRVNPLHVEYRQVETLIPYARNPRTHNDAQIAKIAASIAEFGWTTPILIDADHGIIAGHGRLAAARKLGLADVPVIELTHLGPHRLICGDASDRDVIAALMQDDRAPLCFTSLTRPGRRRTARNAIQTDRRRSSCDWVR